MCANILSQRAPSTERHSGFAWMFGWTSFLLRTQHFIELSFTLCKLHIKIDSPLQVVLCVQEGIILFNCRYQSISQRTLHSGTKGSLDTEVPQETYKNPLKIHSSISLINWLLHQLILSIFWDVFRCFAACWVDASCSTQQYLSS